MAITKEKLSGSTDGKGIKIVQTATAGTAIHTAHATAWDEVYLWAFNSRSSTQLLTIELGGVTDPDNILEIEVPAAGASPTLVLPGWIFTNTAAIAGFAANANEVVVYGFVNRIS